MKNAQSPKMSCLLQIVAEIWTLLGPIISIQNLLILLCVLRFRTQCQIRFRMGISQPLIETKSSFLVSERFLRYSFQISYHILLISQIHLFVMSHFSTLLVIIIILVLRQTRETRSFKSIFKPAIKSFFCRRERERAPDRKLSLFPVVKLTLQKLSAKEGSSDNHMFLTKIKRVIIIG